MMVLSRYIRVGHVANMSTGMAVYKSYWPTYQKSWLKSKTLLLPLLGGRFETKRQKILKMSHVRDLSSVTWHAVVISLILRFVSACATYDIMLKTQQNL